MYIVHSVKNSREILLICYKIILSFTGTIRILSFKLSKKEKNGKGPLIFLVVTPLELPGVNFYNNYFCKLAVSYKKTLEL
jgi:hypothetical protein